MDRYDKLEELVDSLLSLYKKKNSDYGNSFADTVEKLGFAYALGTLNTKVDRAISVFNKGECEIADESIRDTLMDLANYSLMTLVEIDMLKEEEIDELEDEEENEEYLVEDDIPVETTEEEIGLGLNEKELEVILAGLGMLKHMNEGLYSQELYDKLENCLDEITDFGRHTILMKMMKL